MTDKVMNIWDMVSPYLEIAVLWYALYILLVFIKGTRTVQVLKGLLILLLAFLLSQMLDLEVYKLDSF